MNITTDGAVYRVTTEADLWILIVALSTLRDLAA